MSGSPRKLLDSSTGMETFTGGSIFKWNLAAIVFVSAILCYWNAVQCDFVFDDISAIKDNKDLRPSQPLSALIWNDFWGTPMSKENSHKSYRPFTVLTFRWNYGIHELDPFGYHLVNVLIHAVNSVLIYRLFLLFSGQVCSFIGALFFAIHPIHTEAVTGIVGRAELLSTLFASTLFVIFALKTRQDFLWNFAQPVLLLLALFSKEQGITIVAICFVYQIFGAERMTPCDVIRSVRNIVSDKPKLDGRLIHAARRLWVLIASTIGLMFWRMTVMKGQLPVFTTFDNPASAAEFPVKQLTYLYLIPVNIWLLLFPKELLCDYTMGTIPLISSVLDIRILAVVAFVTGIVMLVWKIFKDLEDDARLVLIMACSWMVFPFLPASNLFFPVGFVVAERILYMPSVGFCLIIGFGYERFAARSQRYQKNLLGFLVTVSILAFASKCIVRNWDWLDESTLFRSGLRITQSNAKLFNNVGHVLEKRKDFEEALKFFKRATIAQPDDIGAWNNVGRTLAALNRSAEAEAAWKKASDLLPKPRPGQQFQARIAPQHLNVLLNLGNAAAKDPRRYQEADDIYRKAISMRQDYVEAYINRGDVLLKMNRSRDALQVYKQAVAIDPRNPDIYYNMAVVLHQLKDVEAAVENFNKALEINPEHQFALLNSAILLGELKDPRFYGVIEQRLAKVLQTGKDPNAFFQMGLLMMDKKESDAAAYYFRKTVENRSDHRAGLFNLALLLNGQKKYNESLEFALKLIEIEPEHHKAWILIGDLYINYLKNPAKAEMAYRKILSTEPSNFQAHHNLCVTLIEQDKITEADKCMYDLRVLMHGDLEYVNTHYRTIFNRLEKRKVELGLTPVFK